MDCNKANKVYVIVAILIALIVGILTVSAVQFPPNMPMTGLQKFLACVDMFFRPMIPILGVAALMKFVCCFSSKSCN
tara:strand:+ start:34675 stop:34905 length:231 start_codon:yes stop_codon:yes gene_type:complete